MQRSGVNVPGTQRASCRGPIHQQAVIGLTQKLVVPQRELIPRQEVSAAHRAPKTLHVIHIASGPHHQVAAAEAQVTICTFDAKQSEKDTERYGFVIE